MDDEDDRRLLDIIGDVQALNDYLHGSSDKSIDEDDVTNATLGSATFFSSNSDDPISILKDGANHLGEMEGTGFQLPSSLQFIEEELGQTSPLGGDLEEEQPFDILQKSLQEADITEQTLAQEALLESPPPSQQVSGGGMGMDGIGVLQNQGCTQFPVVQPQGYLQQVPPVALQNGSAGHIQVLGTFNTPAPMVTVNSVEPATSPGLAGGVLMQRPTGQSGVLNSSAGGQVSVPFKGCGTNIPLQNIIIQRGSSQQMLVKPIQPKPLQVGGQMVYNISTVGMQGQNQASPATSYTTNSPQPPQQVTVNIVNQQGLHQSTTTHSGGIVIQSAVGQQSQQSNLVPGQYLLSSSMSFTPGTTTPNVHCLNGQVQAVPEQTYDTRSSGVILTNQNATVQLVAGQNFSGAGQLVVNQGVLQISQESQGLQGNYAVVSSTNSSQTQYRVQPQNVLTGGLQVSQQGHQFLVPNEQDTNSLGVQGVPDLSNQHSMSAPRIPDGLRQTQLVNLLGNKGVKTAGAVEAVVFLQNQVGSVHPGTDQFINLKRPPVQPLTKGDMILQQVRQDQAGVLMGNRTPFSSQTDAVHRLLPYHVFQGSLPSNDELIKVDEEFDSVATHVVQRTQAMLHKYQGLLLAEAEKTCLSSEIVMIDRTFNQDERRYLTQDKRMALVDPEGYQEEFCCRPRTGRVNKTDDPLDAFPCISGAARYHSESLFASERCLLDPSSRTESQPGCKDPGGEAILSKHLEHAVKTILDPRKPQKSSFAAVNNSTRNVSTGGGFEVISQPIPQEASLHPNTDSDSVLEAAVNSILEC